MAEYRAPDPRTIFHLVPHDAESDALLNHEHNKKYVSLSPSTNKPGLEIGYHVSYRRPHGGRVIVVLGQDPSKSDILLTGSFISTEHLRFEVHPKSRALILYNCARTPTAVQISPGGFRPEYCQRVLVPGQKYELSLGLQPRLRFTIVWPSKDIAAMDTTVIKLSEEAERQARIHDIPQSMEASDLRSWSAARFPSKKTQSLVREARIVKRLGGGSFGTVFQGIDLDSGHYVAVKEARLQRRQEWLNLSREVKAMWELSHPNIMPLWGHAGPEDWWLKEPSENKPIVVHIYMPIKSGGSIRNLLPMFHGGQNQDLLESLIGQMLCALDYLASKHMCHRDVKPDNILYDVDENGPRDFQLADFGFINNEKHAETFCGTWVYMAPELLPGAGQHQQSPKMDVWSMFVSFIVMTMPFDEEHLCRQEYGATLAAVRNTINDPGFPLYPLRFMAREAPDRRASAAQMLVKHFEGQGLSSNRSEVPPLDESPDDPVPPAQPTTAIQSTQQAPSHHIRPAQITQGVAPHQNVAQPEQKCTTKRG